MLLKITLRILLISGVVFDKKVEILREVDFYRCKGEVGGGAYFWGDYEVVCSGGRSVGDA